MLKTFKTCDRWDQIVVYSQAEVEFLQREDQIDPDKIEVILFYVDPDFFNPSDVKAKSQPVDFILSQGLTKRGYPPLISAMRELPHINCDINATGIWDKHKAGYELIEPPENVHVKTDALPSPIHDNMADCRFVVIPINPNPDQ